MRALKKFNLHNTDNRLVQKPHKCRISRFQILKKNILTKLKMGIFYNKFPQCKDWLVTSIYKVIYLLKFRRGDNTTFVTLVLSTALKYISALICI